MPAHREGYRQNILATLAAAQPQTQIVAEEDRRIVGSVLLYQAGSVLVRPGGGSITLAEPEVRLLAVEGFDRDAMHEVMNPEIVRFFHRKLRAGESTPHKGARPTPSRRSD